MTRGELRDRLCVLFGGRVAEELLCGDVSTGAQDDLERATELSRQMICRFGMSDELGPVTLGRTTARYLPIDFGESRPYSEETARRIDVAVTTMLTEERERARKLLGKLRPVLEEIQQRLFTKETLERAELEAIVRGRIVAKPTIATTARVSLPV